MRKSYATAQFYGQRSGRKQFSYVDVELQKYSVRLTKGRRKLLYSIMFQMSRSRTAECCLRAGVLLNYVDKELEENCLSSVVEELEKTWNGHQGRYQQVWKKTTDGGSKSTFLPWVI